MKKNSSDRQHDHLSVELKYCERCGCLWLRESGSGGTYCQGCASQIEQLPAAKKPPASVKRLPTRRVEVGDYEFEIEETDDLDAFTGGVA